MMIDYIKNQRVHFDEDNPKPSCKYKEEVTRNGTQRNNL